MVYSLTVSGLGFRGLEVWCRGCSSYVCCWLGFWFTDWVLRVQDLERLGLCFRTCCSIVDFTLGNHSAVGLRQRRFAWLCLNIEILSVVFAVGKRPKLWTEFRHGILGLGNRLCVCKLCAEVFEVCPWPVEALGVLRLVCGVMELVQNRQRES